jgi:hypothetical protein
VDKGSNGINEDSAQHAGYPQLTVFDSKLYAVWNERNMGVNQVRVGVYNGNDSSPSWSYLDYGAYGLNYNHTQNASYPQLTAFNSKIYAIWRENNGSAYQVRVAVGTGEASWSFVDGDTSIGINKDSTKAGLVPQLTVSNSKLYAIWQENNGASDQIRVAVYNGNDSSPSWSFVDGNTSVGINKDSTQYISSPQLTECNSKLYAIWTENDGVALQIRVAVYNGNDSSPSWSFVDGNGSTGINKDVTRNAQFPQLTASGSDLYAIWQENNGVNDQIRVAMYNGNDSSPNWSFADGDNPFGLNKDNTKGSFAPQLTAFNSKLYAIWHELNSVGVNQVRVRVKD